MKGFKGPFYTQINGLGSIVTTKGTRNVARRIVIHTFDIALVMLYSRTEQSLERQNSKSDGCQLQPSCVTIAVLTVTSVTAVFAPLS